MNYTSCNGRFGGNDGCHFRQVCQSNIADRKDKLVQLYQRREEKWNVGKDLE